MAECLLLRRDARNCYLAAQRLKPVDLINDIHGSFAGYGG
jgi:hypothetical protein